jgi:signal transduction histidine kinase
LGSIEAGLAEVSERLAQRRERILEAWRESVRRDRELTTGDSLPLAQLDDHIPELLSSFERRLDPTRGGSAAPSPASAARAQAAAHGLYRWQQGYDLLEVARELGRLNECVIAEIDACAQADPPPAHEVMVEARRVWAGVLTISLGESTEQYFKLRQVEALGHVRDLEQALNDLRELERQRAELWHQAAHDLRGNLSVVVNATSGLTSPAVPEPMRGDFLRMIERNVVSLRHLLDDMTDLARLQTGRERRQVSEFDAASLLGTMCDDLRIEAQQRGLFLHAEGPESLVVQGDPVKTRRLALNLILNAIKYTALGGVHVNWGDSNIEGDAWRWLLTVRDTGPGLNDGTTTPLASAMQAATELNRDAEAESVAASAANVVALQAARPIASLEPHPGRAEHGEGIGLSIVKRLAELLDAGIEVETGTGTTFRVYLPRRYEA